jgi:hypothetical protein
MHTMMLRLHPSLSLGPATPLDKGVAVLVGTGLPATTPVQAPTADSAAAASKSARVAVTMPQDSQLSRPARRKMNPAPTLEASPQGDPS